MTENMREEMTLKKRIEREIMSFTGLMGVYASDLKGREITLNADESFETASTIKSYILAVLYQKVKAGEKSLRDMLCYTDDNFINGSGLLQSLEIGTQLSVKNLATLMIIVSDNIATNILIDYIGLDEINRCIQEMGFTSTKLHRKVGADEWSQLGSTTPRDYGRLFSLIATGTLLEPEWDSKMLEIFKQQHYNTILTTLLPDYYLDSDNFEGESGFFVASKSGTMDNCRSDGGIIGTPYGAYVLVIYTKDFHDRQYHKNHESYFNGGRVSRLMFDQYLALEGRFAL